MNAVEMFKKQELFTSKDVIKSVQLYINFLEANEENYPAKIVKNRIKLCNKFLDTVKKSKLPDLTELFWFYNYTIYDNCIILDLENANEVKLDESNHLDMTSIVENTLIKVECDYLTVEQFAKLHSVDTETTMKWISKGKLRYAKKVGQDWLIPDTSIKPKRGFEAVQYDINSKIESIEFPLLQACSSIYIANLDKNRYICYMNNYDTKFSSEMILKRSEVELLEYTIIESGKASLSRNIQFVPNIR